MREEKEKITKALTILLSVVIMILYFANDIEACEVGIYVGCPVENRLLYNFYHASFLHAFFNVWCLLHIEFEYELSYKHIATAFIVAMSFPICMCHDLLPLTDNLMTPTIGLSGVCYVLMGRISFMVKRIVYYQVNLFLYILIGFLFSNINSWLHLYCYIIGFIIALLNKPLKN